MANLPGASRLVAEFQSRVNKLISNAEREARSAADRVLDEAVAEGTSGSKQLSIALLDATQAASDRLVDALVSEYEGAAKHSRRLELNIQRAAREGLAAYYLRLYRNAGLYRMQHAFQWSASMHAEIDLRRSGTLRGYAMGFAASSITQSRRSL